MQAKQRKLYRALADAVKQGDTQAISTLLDQGANINVGLLVAAGGGPQNIVRLLLNRGADANAAVGPFTALMAAASKGRKDVVRMLLEKGAEINANHSSNNFTPLSSAASNADSETVDLLLSQGALINATALILATKHVDNLRLLLDAGADPDSRNPLGATALMHAARAGRAASIRLLIERGADVNAKNWKGRSVLYYANHPGSFGMVRATLGYQTSKRKIVELLKQAGATEG